MEIKEKVTVQAPVEKVWDLVSDPRNAPSFNRLVQEITEVRQKEGGVGTSWKAISNAAGRMEIASEITEWDPPRHLAIIMDGGPASGTLSFTLTAQGNETTLVEETATSSMPAITAPLIKPMLEQNIKESLQQIKSSVEKG